MPPLCPFCRTPVPDAKLPPGRYPRVCGRCENRFVLVCEANGRVHLQLLGDAGGRPSGGSGNPVSRSGPVSRVPSAPGPPPPPEDPTDIWDRTAPAHGYARRSERASGAVTGGPLSKTEKWPDGSFQLRPPGPPSLGPATSGMSSAGASTYAPRTGGRRAMQQPPPQPTEVPPVVDGFRVRDRLRDNAHGTVYAADDPLTGQPVELLVFHAGVTQDPSLAARLGYAALLATQLDAPNITRARRFGLAGGIMYLASDGVVRRTLADELTRHGPLPPAVAVGFALQAAHGLDYLHRHGIVHRRVNPNTLLLDAGSVVKVSDWGSVRMGSLPTGSTADARFPLAKYLDPELQTNPALRRPRVDVYGLGCTLYSLLTGEPPTASGPANGPPSRTGPASRGRAVIPLSLIRIIGKATATTAAQRYPSVDEFAAALEQWQAEQPDGPPQATAEETEAYRGAARRYTRLTGWGLSGWLALLLPAVATLLALGTLSGRPELGMAVFAAGWAAAAGWAVAASAVSTAELAGLIRKWAAGLGVVDKAVAAAVLVAVTVGLAWGPSPVLSTVGIGIGTGAGVLWAVLAAGRAEAARPKLVHTAREVLKGLRRRGQSELAVQGFAADAGGRAWEPLFRRLFGATAAERIRTARGYENRRRSIPLALCDQFADVLADRERAAVRHALTLLQRRRMAAKGVDPGELAAVSRRVVNGLLIEADRVRSAGDRPKLNENYRTAFDRYAEPTERADHAGWLGRAGGWLIHPRWRAMVGGLALAGGLLWANAAVSPPPTAELDSPSLGLAWLAPEYIPPTWLPPLASRWLASVNPVLAGGLMLAAVGLRSRGWAAAVLAVALLALAGHQFGRLPFADRLGGSFVSLFAAVAAGVYVLVMMYDGDRRGAPPSRPDSGDQGGEAGVGR